MKSVSVTSGRFVILILNIWILAAGLDEGDVGCLFSEHLCDDEQEWCYDDYAFGRCLPLHGPVEKEAFYRYDLLHPDLHALQKEMDRLFRQGYRWSHTYTQCVLQALLKDIHLGMGQFDRSVCDRLIDQDLEAALKAIEGDEQEKLDQRNLAYVQFTPSASNPHPEFADEVYFPPLNDDDLHVNAVEVDADAERPGYYSYARSAIAKRRSPVPTQHNSSPSMLLERLAKRPHMFSKSYNTPDAFREGVETRDELVQQFSHDYNTPDGFREGHETRDEVEENFGYVRDAGYDDDAGDLLSSRFVPDAVEYTPVYGDEMNTLLEENEIPNQYYSAVEEKEQPERIPKEYRVPGTERLPPELRHVAELLYQPEGERVRQSKPIPDQPGGGYTEGGLVFLPEQQQDDAFQDVREREQELDDGLDALLAEYDSSEWGFKRRERLDVKKPGPPFSTNNYAFREHDQQEDSDVKDDKTNKSHRALPTESWKKSLEKAAVVETEDVSPLASPENSKQENQEFDIPHLLPQRKLLPSTDSTDDTSASEQYDIVDTTYAYIGFKDRIRDWQSGTRIVNEVAKLLRVDPGSFTMPKIGHNEVVFKVESNSQGLNASEVAKRIESIKGELKEKIGVDVTSAGIGNKTKLPSVLVAPDSQHELYIATFLLCGAVAAVLVAATALYVIRRHARSREKLQNLTAPDTEASKDYQELCRARMANKAQQEKPEPIHVGQRIASLSRESEGSNNSPSSRSSTSSWSEEPALTNMDISTGHMVLSYMEDHLKNKDRLEQEWVALCAYEAEPCATTLAKKPENSKKNRYMDYLPYDHSRVVLNDLANISGSDYINASTITDHDPRNPAYIATQGPLPHTAPDFWQMVWEQGSVVMVMLTRLTEGGTAMCHRYWPEEGSELYHIYEVHLVSEHIWCDDYLVRSFYLKNLKTGETRTVTQFHFLSWPDAGVPLSTKALLEFRRKVNKSYRGRSCPIVVHCSDGVGRTGTYCLIDMVLNRMAKGAKEIDIAATLEHIRDQRQAMVRTKQQFEFVLMAVAEEVHAILKALPSQQQPQPQQPPPHQQSPPQKQPQTQQKQQSQQPQQPPQQQPQQPQPLPQPQEPQPQPPQPQPQQPQPQQTEQPQQK